jgi:hypothetical protein
MFSSRDPDLVPVRFFSQGGYNRGGGGGGEVDEGCLLIQRITSQS